MFNKDLLLIDEETSGLDPHKHEIIQLAAVLLDKKTLKEKAVFNSYISPKKWRSRDLKSMAVNKISWNQIKNAPDLKTVLQKFNRAFRKPVILAYYVGVNDINFLKAAYQDAGLRYPFDYHTFNIWGLFYPILALKNRLNNRKEFSGFSLKNMLSYFKIPQPKNLHDALVDCRAEAEILRRVIKVLKK